MLKRMIFLLLLTSFLRAQISPAVATSFYIQPFPEFIRSAPLIVAGRVSQIHVDYSITSDGSRAIYTYANLAVREVVKGDLAGRESLALRYAGGTKDGITLEVPGHPDFTENEDVLVFLSSEKEDGSHELVAMELGKFEVKIKNGEEVLSGGIFNYPAATPEAQIVNKKDWSLKELRRVVREQSDPTLEHSPLTPSPNKFLAETTSPKNLPVKNEAHDLDQVSSAIPALSPRESGENPSLLPFIAIALVFAAGAAVFLRRRKK